MAWLFDWFEDMFGGVSDPGPDHPTPWGLGMSKWSETLPYPVNVYMQAYYSGVFDSFGDISGARVWAQNDYVESVEATASASWLAESPPSGQSVESPPSDRSVENPPSVRTLERLDRGGPVNGPNADSSVSPAGNALGY